MLSSEIATWESQRNQQKPSVYWGFNTKDARKKCRVYIRAFNLAKLPWQTTSISEILHYLFQRRSANVQNDTFKTFLVYF
jgi:hypothetical protein